MARVNELYRVEQLPVFQNRMFPTREEARCCDRGDVVLVQDEVTGLVYNSAFDPDLVAYDTNYQNEQGLSEAFGRHLDQVVCIVDQHLSGGSLIEVGCGKGHFLERLQARGYDIRGFDPTYDGQNPLVSRTYFGPGSGAIAEGLVMRHVLEHVQDPVGFLAHIARSNGNQGLVYIEVPCFDWIMANRAWFDIYYEHVNYFRLSDFGRLFGTVVEAGRLFDGQYLYVVADLATVRLPRANASDRLVFPVDFTDGVDRALKSLDSRRSGATSAVWGGSSKGVIFSLFMERGGLPVDMVIDINKAKQGLFLPATGIQVRSPHDALKVLAAGDTIMIMNRNYLDEIRSMTQSKFKYITVDNEYV